MGKWLILAGVIIALLGVLVMVLGRIGLFKLPGDPVRCLSTKNYHFDFVPARI